MKFSSRLVRWILILAMLPAAGALQARLQTTATAYQWDGRHFSIPLEIRDNSGVRRSRWPVTSGVPLPYGLVKRPDDLRLVDADGREIDCQFTVLSRYWARDGSIRWLLLDFQVDLPPNGTTVVRLQNDRPHASIANPLLVTEGKESIRIDTGPLKVEIPRNHASLFERVQVRGEVVLETAAGDGPFLRSARVPYAQRFWGDEWNTHGWEKNRKVSRVDVPEALHQGVLSPSRDVEVETAGPMRTTLVLRGRYRPTGGTKLPKGLTWNFTTRLHFYRGHTFVQVEHAIENSSDERPQWVMPFLEAGLRHSLKLEPVAMATLGIRKPPRGKKHLVQVALLPGEKATLLQLKQEKKGHPPRVLAHTPGDEAAPTEGRALFADISDAGKGVAVTLRYFAEKAPRQITLSNKGLEVQLHAPPRGEGRPWELDLAGRSIGEILYLFHDTNLSMNQVASIAEAYQYPLFARAPVEWYSHTDAWYFEIAPRTKPKKKPPSDHHWRADPEFWKLPPRKPNFNSGGHHSSLNSGWLSYLLDGSLQELEKNLALSKRAISYPGWAYLDNELHFGKGGDRYSHLDRALDRWDRLTAFGPKDFYLWLEDPGGNPKKGWRGKTYLNQYKWLPDHEHYAYFRLFEYYYLTGDRFALDAIHGFVDWDLNFQHRHLFKKAYRPLEEVDLFEEDPDALRRGHYSRVYSWMLFTNLAGFEATGSEVMDQFARWQLRRALGLLRHRHGQLTSWRPKPGKAIGFLPKDWRESIARHVDLDLLREDEEVIQSGTQTWMEAQGVLALHEAYKAYGDERILDGIWGLADYFSHHVLFFPKLGMINQWTFMPSPPLGGKFQGRPTIQPQRHDRVLQAWPILYHYTGWPEVKERYDAFEKKRGWVREWFLQTGRWERNVEPKKSTQPPSRITDLRVVKADRSGITLAWTAPADDGSTGRAVKYFVKYSRKPIVEFAPTDNPAREARKRQIVALVDSATRFKSKGNGLTRQQRQFVEKNMIFEAPDIRLEHPDWHRVNAFWMAEHVDGEPRPGPAGSTETFTIRKLLPHDWLGAPGQPGLEILEPGTYYLAICSWDEDRNLSRLSNVVSVELR